VFDTLPEGQSPRMIAVCCHGFGAPGTDLVGLGPELAGSDPEIARSVRFVFPEAPVSLDSIGYYGGRAWWHLDLEARMQAIERGQIRDLRNDIPAGLDVASDHLTSLIQELGESHDLPASRFVLAGFSQGAMIATEVALNLPQSPAGLCLFSGTLMNEQNWKRQAAERGPLPVFQSHGRQDPILPFVAAEWLRDLLLAGGIPVEFLPFQGPHTIPREALAGCARMLVRLSRDA